jgi:hypothetical protein
VTKFNIFLRNLELQLACTGPQPLYEKLGGEKKLSISLRTFRAVYAGQLRPSISLFSAIFCNTPDHLKKEALVSYFNSVVTSDEAKKTFNEFLSQNLTVRIDGEAQSLWQKSEAKFFSERQLQFLNASNVVVRAYSRLVCHGSISYEEAQASGYIDALDGLVSVGIARRSGKNWVGNGNLFRLPSQDNSPAELVAPATDFIIRNISAYIVREGSPGTQELGYSFHTCRRVDAEKILEQMKYFKRWVQNMGLKEDHPDEVGFIWVDFGRILIRNRDY